MPTNTCPPTGGKADSPESGFASASESRPSRREFLATAARVSPALPPPSRSSPQRAWPPGLTPRTRGAFCLQRALANELAFPESNPGGLPLPQLVTSRQVIEMATIAGAAANRLLDKVGTLTPGKEADIVVLDARNINTWPMNNVPGTIVTMMNPRHVRDVFIAGKVV